MTRRTESYGVKRVTYELNHFDIRHALKEHVLRVFSGANLSDATISVSVDDNDIPSAVLVWTNPSPPCLEEERSST